MSNLVITKYKSQIVSAVYENGKMAEFSLEDGKSSSVIGNIYVGMVESIVKNINAALWNLKRV